MAKQVATVEEEIARIASAWEQDLRREREAHAREDLFRRFSHDDVFVDHGYMLAVLHGLLRSGRS